jgi:hypothetical protein
VSRMSPRTVRVTVRGAFDGLTDDQRAELVAEQSEHDFLHTEYTPEGHLTYDLPGRPFFTFRFLATAAEEKDVPVAAALAEEAAAAWLTGRGYGFKNLTSNAVDMSEVPLGARGKKLAR